MRREGPLKDGCGEAAAGAVGARSTPERVRHAAVGGAARGAWRGEGPGADWKRGVAVAAPWAEAERCGGRAAAAWEAAPPGGAPQLEQPAPELVRARDYTLRAR